MQRARIGSQDVAQPFELVKEIRSRRKALLAKLVTELGSRDVINCDSACQRPFFIVLMFVFFLHAKLLACFPGVCVSFKHVSACQTAHSVASAAILSRLDPGAWFDECRRQHLGVLRRY